MASPCALLLIEIIHVGQCRPNLLHEFMLRGDRTRSEPRPPYFWQACLDHFVFALASRDLLLDERDRFIQELNKLPEVKTIR
jgi:hypothetical protein